MELVNRILEILEKSGLTPSEFADKIEVQRSAISHITSGRNKPSLEFLIKIKKAFPEIDTDWLIFGTEKEVELTENPHPISNSTPTLFELDFENEIPEESNAPIKANSASQIANPIKKIVIFYQDGTFEDFSPNQK